MLGRLGLEDRYAAKFEEEEYDNINDIMKFSEKDFETMVNASLQLATPNKLLSRIPCFSSFGFVTNIFSPYVEPSLRRF